MLVLFFICVIQKSVLGLHRNKATKIAEIIQHKQRSTMFNHQLTKNIQRELGSFYCLLRDFLHNK